MTSRLPMDERRLDAFCRRWMVSELSLFGSVLRDDFRPDSDVDVLVSFEPGAMVSLLDHAAMADELSEILGRKVDLLSRRAVERSRNPIRQRAILSTAEPFHASR
ncbi:MAG: nucleotidyltransferase family protein [Deltaproteobacteria bacterium]|nr:nucleotidyltransferase family protein [Deltaproteobacteria bacterium]